MNKERYADILVDNQCYVNTNRTDEEPIMLPDGSAMPVYLSCRRLFSRVNGRQEVETALAEMVNNEFPDTNLIVGLATAGIGWGHAVAAQLNLPFAYVRSSTKGYGLGQLVEGDPLAESKAVVVDDVLYTGKSLFTAIDVLQDEKNIDTVGVASIITLNGGGIEAYKDRGVAAASLTDYEHLLDSARRKELVSQSEYSEMLRIYATSKVLER